MKKPLVYLLLSVSVMAGIFLVGTSARADDDDPASPSPEVIISGDSWATLPCFFGSAEAAFFNRDIDVDIHGCLETSHIGARAENFKTYSAYGETLKHLKTNPLAKVVYLSLGGNDMFAYWTKTMSSQEETALFSQILGHVQSVVDDIHKVRPDVWVLVSGYDFGYLYANNPISSYRDIYIHMGSPSALEVNSGFLRFANYMTQIKGDHVVYQHHFGLMQYYYGAPEANVAPGKTVAPNLISPANNPAQAGGVVNARNNRYAQAHIFDWYFDPHHLRPHGFMKLFEHAIDGYMGKWVSDGFLAHSGHLMVDKVDGTVPKEKEAQGAKMVQDSFN